MSFFSSFFSSQKKQRLNDFSFLKTDFHSHLIPGIDDGSQSLGDSIQLIHELSSLGFKKIITSPHIMTDGYNNSSSVILDGRDKVREELARIGNSIEFDAVAEYYLDESIFEKINKRDLLTFGDNYVLVELSYFNKSFNTSKYFFELRSAGYKVVLAHPERYPYFHSDSLEMYQEIVDSGVFLQLNLTSLTGVYGKSSKAIAEKLIDKSLIHFAATDTHNLRHIQYLKNCFESDYLYKLSKLNLLNEQI